METINTSNTTIDKTIHILEEDIKEVDELISSTDRTNVKNLLEDYKKNLNYSLTNEKKNYETNKARLDKTPVNSLVYNTIFKYAVDDSNKFSKIYIYDGFENFDKHPKEKIITQFTSDTLEVTILDWKTKNYKFSLKNLLKDIIPNESYLKQTKSGFTIMLKKKEPETWLGLIRE